MDTKRQVKAEAVDMDEIGHELRLKRLRILSKARALHEEVVVNLGKLHGAALTGLGNEAASIGVLLGMMESMDQETFLFSPKTGNQRSQIPIAVATDEAVDSEHDHSYMMLYNHLQRRGVKDGSVHTGCLEHGFWHFFTSDMMRPISLIAGGAQEVRRYLEKPVGVYFFGEGAVSQGVAHEVFTWLSAQNYQRSAEQLKKYESMPLSDKAQNTGVLRPVPFIGAMEINRKSIYTDEIDEHGKRADIGPDGKSRFAKWAETYGIRGVDVDGDDLEAVIDVTKKAIDYAQQPAPQATLLLLHMEGRRTAHNEHQINRPPDARKNRDWSKGEIIGVDPEEFSKLWENEPLKRYIRYLADTGVGSEEELWSVLEEERKLMGERWERAYNAPEATFEDSVKDRELFSPHKWTLPLEKPENMAGQNMTTDRAFLWIMDELMREDEGVVYSGEDVGSGGVLVATRKLQQKLGPERVSDAPIAEEAIYGTTAGASLARWILKKYGIVNTLGTKFCESQFMPFNADAEVLMRSIWQNWWQKRMPFAFVCIEHYGVVHGGGSGPQHSADDVGHYLQMPGIAVVCPSNAYDLVGLMRAAYECGRPVVFMSPIWSYGEKECAREIPKEKYLIPIGKAEVKRKGKDISVITYGNGTNAALREAEFLSPDGIDIEVIDLRTIQPLDMQTIAESIKKTGRVVVVSEATPQVAEMIIGRIVSNPDLRDTLSRTQKPRQERDVQGGLESEESMREKVSLWIKDVTSPIFKELAGHDLEIYNRGPRILPLSRDWTPVTTAEDVEWGDLPFEPYELIYYDEDEDRLTKNILRSVRLSAIAHDLMRY